MVTPNIGRVKAGNDEETVWTELYGGTLDEEVAGIVQAEDGGYVFAGTTFSFSAGGADFWLVKVDEDGNMLWNHTYGGSGVDVATAVVSTSDGGYLFTGETASFGGGIVMFGW